jgi:UDP-glucose 4-epimerase
MTVLVTGGAGFIGSHLVAALLEEGHRVRVLDDLSTGKGANLDIDHPQLELQVGDVCNRPLLESCMDGVSAVAHLAAIASVQASVDDPVATHRINFGATLEVLEAARRLSTQRVVFASSAAVYGNSAPRPTVETAPTRPASPYASDKLASEHYLEFYKQQFGVSTIALRFFNVYGPRQDPHSPYSGVISIFAERGLVGQPVTVYGDGEQTRDFVYVSDVARFLMRALSSPVTGSFNLGTGLESSLNQLIARLDTLLDHSIERLTDRERGGDVRHSLANNGRLLEAFGGMEFTQLDVGLESYLESLVTSTQALN